MRWRPAKYRPGDWKQGGVGGVHGFVSRLSRAGISKPDGTTLQPHLGRSCLLIHYLYLALPSSALGVSMDTRTLLDASSYLDDSRSNRNFRLIVHSVKIQIFVPGI